MTLFEVRCPNCGRMAAEASAGATIRVKCGRCSYLYRVEVESPEPHAMG